MSNVPDTPFAVPNHPVVSNELFKDVDWSLPFYIYADHGQTIEEASCIQVEYYSKSDECTVAPEDVENYEAYDIIKVNVIYGS